MTSEFKNQITAFIEHCNEVAANHGLKNVKHTAEYNKKWCKIVRFEETNNHRSVYAFVCLEDGRTQALGSVFSGDIHKPASWNAPAKHARGNIFSENFGNCAQPFGIKYLRHPEVIYQADDVEEV